MGSTSKVCAVILRVWELVCSAVVLGIVARFVDRINDAGVGNDSRLIYTLVLASISTLYSILFMPPFLYNFLAFAADFILFIMWMVAFGLLANRSATNTCNSYWYWNYWGYYWGGWYYNPIVVNGPADIAYSGCSQWRAVLAFSFMASITFLLSAILGLIVVTKHYGWGEKDKTPRTPTSQVTYNPSADVPPHAAGGAQPNMASVTTPSTTPAHAQV